MTVTTPAGLSPVGLVGYGQAPIPAPQVAVADVPTITYLCTDLYSNTICDHLPFTGVTFGLKLNDAGQFQGSLNVEDPRVQNLDWIAATAPNLACLWVMVNGTAVWGGIVQQRSYTMSKQQVTVTANDFWQYVNQRVQTVDYSNTWVPTDPNSTGIAGAVTMAETILSDAFAAAGSLPVGLVTQGTVPPQYYIIASFPLSQTQQLGGLVQQLQTLGYNVGFDFASDVTTLTGGVPVGQVTLSYPRRGRVAGTTGLIVDTSQAVDMTWPEDGTQQAVQIWEMATAAGGVGSMGQWAPAMSVDGYPLLQAVESHMVFSATTYYTDSEVSSSQPVLDAWVADDLMLYAYPALAPTVTVPLFGNLQLGDFIVGDDIRFVVPRTVSYSSSVNLSTQFDSGFAFDGPLPFAGLSVPVIPSTQGMSTCPRFPNGLDTYLRIVGCDVTISDEGLSTMQLTFNAPPTATPQRPPQ